MVHITSLSVFWEVFCFMAKIGVSNAINRVIQLFHQHGGIMRMKDVLREGVSRNALYAMRDSGKLEQLARGLYRLAEMPPLHESDLVTVVAKMPRAVIYLVSALAFHGLTTQIPHEVWIAIPRNDEPPRLNFPPVRVSRLREDAYRTGVELHQKDGITLPVYSREKTLVDCFSRRNEVGLDVAIEALKTYRRGKNLQVDLIMEYARKLRVANAMRPYLEAIL